MKRSNIIYFTCIVVCILSLSLKAEAANWKLYYKNAEISQGVNCNIYYNKDSVYYPKQTEEFFGKKRDISFIGMWTKAECQDGTVMKYHLYLSCQERQITLNEIMVNDKYAYPPQLNKTYFIEPNSTDELLVGLFCK